MQNISNTKGPLSFYNQDIIFFTLVRTGVVLQVWVKLEFIESNPINDKNWVNTLILKPIN